MLNNKTIGVLALQGAFIEHIHMLESLGATCYEIRQLSDLTIRKYDGIVLPGGESTTQTNLLKKLDIFDYLQKLISDGLPVLATCAGAILLADNICDNTTEALHPGHLQTLPVTIRRNAYGRQLGSFTTTSDFGPIKNVSMTFIRAPYFNSIESPDVKVLSTVDDHVVAVRYQNQVALSFHPEVTEDTRIHEYFLQEVC
ncbi:MAG: pyridoxal 5'-phosphate synthase glutaminase subunit PdxT [Pseudobutyrivibrio sp.]|nr:pyridoxal 5'-phosphate synthase glutaminase subunit PdxT [Pseudobutyrivibrio sp.]